MSMVATCALMACFGDRDAQRYLISTAHKMVQSLLMTGQDEAYFVPGEKQWSQVAVQQCPSTQIYFPVKVSFL